MGRGVSSGGGQSSLDYLFGIGEAPKPTATTNGTSPAAGSEVPRMQNEVAKEIPQKSTTASPSSPPGVAKEIPAGIPGNTTITNNYFRADGQNCGNFLTAEFFRFYEVCKSLDVGHGERFIKIEQSPASFLQAMEEYVREAPRVSIVRKDQEGYIKLWNEAIQVLGEVNTYMQP